MYPRPLRSFFFSSVLFSIRSNIIFTASPNCLLTFTLIRVTYYPAPITTHDVRSEKRENGSCSILFTRTLFKVFKSVLSRGRCYHKGYRYEPQYGKTYGGRCRNHPSASHPVYQCWQTTPSNISLRSARFEFCCPHDHAVKRYSAIFIAIPCSRFRKRKWEK
jgi:hypothetical protein